MAASLALHALLLFGLPDFIDTARRAASVPPMIIARLMAPEPEPAPVAPAPPAAEKKKPEAPKPVPRITRPVPQAAPPPPPAVRAEAPAPPVEAPAPPAPVAAPPPIAAAESRAGVPEQQAAAVPDSLSRDQYRLQLIEEAKRHKRYPPVARENNWQGKARVGVAIAANGRPTVTLKGSSGYEVLDRQAIEMFTQAARAVPVPAALRGREFALEVGAIYGLED
jgi:protein TonB